jgi:hypothetical protein
MMMMMMMMMVMVILINSSVPEVVRVDGALAEGPVIEDRPLRLLGHEVILGRVEVMVLQNSTENFRDLWNSTRKFRDSVS